MLVGMAGSSVPVTSVLFSVRGTGAVGTQLEGPMGRTSVITVVRRTVE